MRGFLLARYHAIQTAGWKGAGAGTSLLVHIKAYLGLKYVSFPQINLVDVVKVCAVKIILLF